MTGIKHRKAPPDEGALYMERVMMNRVIILVILLVISLPAY
ncbi:type I toxin-antitoxin system Ibs family toxin [Kluyvera cryocrescens]|nr:type I toxin-antitoxin system Ibs family toxin [Kluyvera cryocrescens]